MTTGSRQKGNDGRKKLLRPISHLEATTCPVVGEEDGELVYRVTGC